MYLMNYAIHKETHNIICYCASSIHNSFRITVDDGFVCVPAETFYKEYIPIDNYMDGNEFFKVLLLLIDGKCSLTKIPSNKNYANEDLLVIENQDKVIFIMRNKNTGYIIVSSTMSQYHTPDYIGVFNILKEEGVI